MPAPTLQQSRAIAARSNVLVLAGAGAGKTSTLVARLLDRVIDAPDRVSLDRILVVTFNEAAAAEMRHRLASALSARVREAPEDPWLAEAIALLDVAAISTLHAFCLRLIREHFHELGLDPRFAVLGEGEAAVLSHRVMDDLLRGYYAGDGSGEESDLVRRFLLRHAPDGDRAIRERILQIHDYARSLPDPQGWLTAHLAHAGQEAASRWVDAAVPGLRRWAADWVEHLEALVARTPDNPAAARCLGRLRDGDALAGEAIPGWLEGILSEGAPGQFPRGKAGLWKKPLETLFEEAGALRAYFGADAASWTSPLEEDWRWARDDQRAVLLLVRQFMSSFAQARLAAAAVDFSDLEQLALRLLWDPAIQGPTTLARHWQSRFEHVFVDEYQDINGAQDRLLTCLSREGDRANRFLVGDVKQSIYRFRRADPRIFQHYAAAWRGDGAPGCVLPLSENFRSHEAILDFVNDWFSRLMRPAVGGVGYDAEARLIFGAPDQRTAWRADPQGRVELHLLVPDDDGDDADAESEGGGGDDSDGDELDAEELQAGIAARRLKAWHDEGLSVRDASSGEPRPVTWRDMVVLHPGPRPVGERWARRFAQEGVPLEARRGGFLDATEVSDLLNLARLLDNPVQDVPLLAVLRSPLSGFTDAELATLRLVAAGGRLWDAVTMLGGPAGAASAARVAEEHPCLRAVLESARERATEFLKHYAGWRELAREGSLAACLETVLVETGYEAWLQSRPRSSGRLANLRKLLGLARQFDAHQRQGLFRFLCQIEEQQKAGAVLESASCQEGNAVRLLSMHQSKGLEFPVVVVAGLGRRFHLGDLQGPWLLDEEYGLCPPVAPPGSRRFHPSLPRWLAGRRQRREALGEQIRLLYVACTRAVERLVLLGRAPAKRLDAWSGDVPTPSPRELAQASEPLAWLGPCLPHLTGNPDWAASRDGRGTRLDWRIHGARSASPDAGGDAARGPASALPGDHPIPDEVVDALRRKIGTDYPWSGATREAGKAAVTALRRRWAEYRDDESVQESVPVVAVPAGLRSSNPDAVERGLAHHTFCELFDLAQPGTLDAMRSEAERLRESGWLRDDQVALLDLESLAELWGSDIGQRLRDARESVQRELPFTARLRPRDAARLGHPGAESGLGPDDFQVIQGVVDLAVFLPDEIWIVDFKTDRVGPEELSAKADEYRVQLGLYAHALTSIHHRPVTRRWLYFLTPRRWVEV